MLQHVLSFLLQNDAVRTCVLSKSWRYLWFAHPNLEFRQICFNGDKQTFLSVLDTTLQRYHDQKLSVRDFVFEMFKVDSESISLLENWIPIVITNRGVKMFHLSFSSHQSAYFDLPSIVFKAESLQELYLGKCNLSRINSDKTLMFKHLHKLSLVQVYIEETALEKLMSSCPLIEYVVIARCEGLININVTKCNHDNLKHFVYRHHTWLLSGSEKPMIEIDAAPNLETIIIVNCTHLFPHNKYFPHLKYLHLNHVELSKRTSFIFFSSNYLPRLLCLTLDSCYGFQEFHLSNHSVMRLILKYLQESVLASIDAPNMVKFEYIGDFCPSDITFTTTSNEWKSDIRLCDDVGQGINDASTSWFLKLSKMLKALSPSEISLEIFQRRRRRQHMYHISLGSYEAVIVEHLHLSIGHHTFSSLPGILDCRKLMYSDARPTWELEEKRLTEFFWKILFSNIPYSWQGDLAIIIMQVFDEDLQAWQIVDQTRFMMNSAAFLPENQHKLIRF